MCKTTCNNHSHEEYNVDYIENEQALDITTENVPCNHEQNIYIVQDTEDDQCDCNKCSKCEPKKVSCRSLACQQLNDECSCKRKKKKIRKTTMVNVLENNLLRLEDKMNDGCADMHESIEDLEENVNKVYNELKDEEARAKQQEAFLHYGLDDAVTRAWYNPEDRKIHFYHKNPANCLNVNVNEGCDCDCCNACGCECKCNNDECQSDIPYTMDDDCNIIPMSRYEEELPFSIDCTDFLRDIFISNAYLEEGLVDPEGDITHQFLIIEFTRYLEPGLPVDDDQSVTPHTIRIDLTELWKLDNYYDKWKIDELIQAIYDYIDQKVAELNARIQAVDNRVTQVDNRVTQEVNTLNTTIDNTKTELNQSIDNTKTELNQTIDNTKHEFQEIINNLNFDPTVEDYHNVCNYGEETVIASVNNTNITVKMPDAIDPSQFTTTVINSDPTLGTESKTIATVNNTAISAKIPNVVQTISKSGDNLVITDVSGNTYNIELPQPADPGEGADGNDYVVSGTVNSNNELILTRKDGGTVPPIQLPLQPEPKHITNVTQKGDTVTFTWSDNSTPTTINVGGACLWKEYNDGLIPVNESKKVYGAGFYDTTVGA